MSLLPGSQFRVDAQLIHGSVGFSPDASTGPLLGNSDGGNSIGAMPAGSLFFSHVDAGTDGIGNGLRPGPLISHGTRIADRLIEVLL